MKSNSSILYIPMVKWSYFHGATLTRSLKDITKWKRWLKRWGLHTPKVIAYNCLGRILEFTHICSFLQAVSALSYVYGSNYSTIGNCEATVGSVSGSSIDWAHGEAKIPYSFAMELRPEHNGTDNGYDKFRLPPDQIIPTGEEIWAFHKVAAEMIAKEFIFSRP